MKKCHIKREETDHICVIIITENIAEEVTI